MTKTGKGMAEQAKRSASFAAASPDVIEAFNLMRSRCCNDEGVLSFKTKELIAVLFCGGPGWAYSSIALDAYDDMLRDQEEAQEEK